MNLNLHVVNVSLAGLDVAFEDIERAAYDALTSQQNDEATLLAMAELVDMERAALGALTGLGRRCLVALEYRTAFNARLRQWLASRCGCMEGLSLSSDDTPRERQTAAA